MTPLAIKLAFMLLVVVVFCIWVSDDDDPYGGAQ